MNLIIYNLIEIIANQYDKKNNATPTQNERLLKLLRITRIDSDSGKHATLAAHDPQYRAPVPGADGNERSPPGSAVRQWYSGSCRGGDKVL